MKLFNKQSAWLVVLSLSVACPWVKSHAKEFLGCTPVQKSKLEFAEILAIQKGRQLLGQIESTIAHHPNRGFETQGKLRLASFILGCATQQLKKLHYICEGPDPDSVAEVDWIFARSIQIRANLLENIYQKPNYTYSPHHVAALLLHEASHKCGTTDASYFLDSPPRDTRWISWAAIADTYRYWADHGLCVPGEGC